jgi:hypothetical protein
MLLGHSDLPDVLSSEGLKDGTDLERFRAREGIRFVHEGQEQMTLASFCRLPNEQAWYLEARTHNGSTGYRRIYDEGPVELHAGLHLIHAAIGVGRERDAPQDDEQEAQHDVEVVEGGLQQVVSDGESLIPRTAAGGLLHNEANIV